MKEKLAHTFQDNFRLDSSLDYSNPQHFWLEYKTYWVFWEGIFVSESQALYSAQQKGPLSLWAPIGSWNKSELCIVGLLWSLKPYQTACVMLFIQQMENIALQLSARKGGLLGEVNRGPERHTGRVHSSEGLTVKESQSSLRQDREKWPSCLCDWWSVECKGRRESKHFRMEHKH